MQSSLVKQAKNIVEKLDVKFNDISFEYFTDIWDTYWSKLELSDVFVTEMGIPDIFIRSLWESPCYLFGGLYDTDVKTGEIFPQISDPIVKSTFSILSAMSQDNVGKDVVVPVQNISSRKSLAYISELGYSVTALQQDGFSHGGFSQFEEAQEVFLLELQKRAEHILSKEKMSEVALLSTAANRLFLKLDNSVLPTLLTSFIRQTYYMANNIQDWNIQTEKLLGSVNETDMATKQVSLYGSSIYFPNAKIPFILGDLGITKYRNHCGVPSPCSYEKLLKECNINGSDYIDKLHNIHYRWMNLNLGHLHNPCAKELKNSSGVIYHLLKGQLLYAYQAELVEKECISNGIPFVCVETDYTDADTEQLKIRLEAFSELIRQSGQMS